MISPLDIATQGYLCDSLSVGTDGYICVDVEIQEPQKKKVSKSGGGGFSVPSTRRNNVVIRDNIEEQYKKQREIDDMEITLIIKIFTKTCL